MDMRRLSWLCYLIGSLLVFGSWVGLVPTGVAWVGWLVALGGWAALSASRRSSSACQRPVSSSSRVLELERLAILHKEGVLDDAEFEREKQRILRQP